jgi:hypothetical protein
MTVKRKGRLKSHELLIDLSQFLESLQTRGIAVFYVRYHPVKAELCLPEKREKMEKREEEGFGFTRGKNHTHPPDSHLPPLSRYPSC